MSFGHGIVRNCLVPPERRAPRIARDPQLRDVARTQSEEARIVKDRGAPQPTKSIDPVGRPTAMRLNLTNYRLKPVDSFATESRSAAEAA